MWLKKINSLFRKRINELNNLRYVLLQMSGYAEIAILEEGEQRVRILVENIALWEPIIKEEYDLLEDDPGFKRRLRKEIELSLQDPAFAADLVSRCLNLRFPQNKAVELLKLMKIML